MMYEDKLQDSGKYKKARKRQREQEKKNQKKFKKKRPTAKGMKGTFKSIVYTNKIL